MTETTTDIWNDIRDERQELLDLLETLSSEQWDAASLCEGWRVRDVVGHLLVGTADVSRARLLRMLVRARFSIDRAAFDAGRQMGSAPVGDLLEAFRAAVPTRTHLPIFEPESLLAEIVLHQLDIRRPLGESGTTPEHRMRQVGTFVLGSRWFPARKLVRRFRFEADDADWSVGTGPIVTGSLETLTFALSGRFTVCHELHGDGLGAFRSEVGA